MSVLFDNTVDSLSKSLDLYLMRHGVITENIANSETPYFKARKVDFENELSKAIESESNGSAPGSIHQVQAKVYEDPDAEMGQDLNTVDMDREMASLTKNDLKYSAATQAIQKKFALLKFAATDGADR